MSLDNADLLYFKGKPYHVLSGLAPYDPSSAFHERFNSLGMHGCGHGCVYVVDGHLWLERIVVNLRDFDQAKALEGRSPLLFGVAPMQLGSPTSRQWVYPVHKLMRDTREVGIGWKRAYSIEDFFNTKPYEPELEIILAFEGGKLSKVKRMKNKTPLQRIKSCSRPFRKKFATRFSVC